MKNLKNKPVTNPIAEDAINRDPQTPKQNDTGIPYRSSLVTPPVNDFWYQLSKQMQYENFTGGYYSASAPYDEGNVVKLIRQNEDSSYEMMFFIRLGSNIDLTTDNPPIKNATTVNLNGIYVYVGGEENSDWQKLIYSKTDINKMFTMLPVGSVIPIHYIGSTSETVDEKTPIPNYGTWEKISSAGFLRFKSDNANESRQTNGYQGDAIRNMVGMFQKQAASPTDNITEGVFTWTNHKYSFTGGGGDNNGGDIRFDTSRVVPTSNTENRVANEGTWEFWKRVS